MGWQDGHRVTEGHRVAEEAGERWIGFLGVGSVSRVLGMERAAVLVMLWHSKITALFKPRKKDPAPGLQDQASCTQALGFLMVRSPDLH